MALLQETSYEQLYRWAQGTHVIFRIIIFLQKIPEELGTGSCLILPCNV